MSIGPLLEFNNDLVAHVGGASCVSGGRHVDVLRHARIIRNHIEKFATLLQGADNLAAMPFKDAHHFAGKRRIILVTPTFGFDVQSNKNVVIIHCRSGVGR